MTTLPQLMQQMMPIKLNCGQAYKNPNQMKAWLTNQMFTKNAFTIEESPQLIFMDISQRDIFSGKPNHILAKQMLLNPWAIR